MWSSVVAAVLRDQRLPGCTLRSGMPSQMPKCGAPPLGCRALIRLRRRYAGRLWTSPAVGMRCERVGK